MNNKPYVSAKKQGIPKSAETKAKMAASQKGRVFTDEHRAKLSASKQGKNNNRYGTTREYSPRDKYVPAVIASFPTRIAAMEATGITQNYYGQLKRKHPELPWPTS